MMAIFRFPLAFLLSGVILGVAISGCDDDGDGDDGPIALSEVQERGLRAYCEKAIECPNFGIGLVLDSVQSCVAIAMTEEESPFLEQTIEAVNEGRTRYDSSAASECLDVMDRMSCADFYDGPGPEICKQMFVGLQDDGATCVDDTECTGGWCDSRTDCPGSCAALVGEGGDCSNGERCDWNLSCMDGICVVDPGPLAQGQECGLVSVWDCAYGLWCDGVSGVCEDQAGAGHPCEADRECEPGLGCYEGICGEPTLVTSAGGDCDPTTGLFCNLGAGLVCTMGLSETYESCQPAAQAGETCVDMEAQLLTLCDPLEPIYCDALGTGLCEAKKVGGTGCQSSEECRSGFCNEGSCADEIVDPC